MRRSNLRVFHPLVVVVAAGAGLHATPTRACGGLFCSAQSPTPVDQDAERILFEVEDDGSVTATVEIQYKGNPDAFSWIVPVPDVPDVVSIAPKDTLLLLDASTRPQLLQPPQDFSNCSTSGGVACGDEALASPSDALNRSEAGGLQVTQYPSVGPFSDIVTVGGGTPDELIAFLNDNGYLVTAPMRPFIEQYTTESFRFLAVQLAPDADVDDIVPIRFHCPAEAPTIPLRLTAIAARPEMGILTFIAGASRYEPSSPYSEVDLGDRVRVSAAGSTNYFPLISRELDRAGGLGFVVERAGPATTIGQAVNSTFLGTDAEQAARDEVTQLLSRRAYLTRLYTRMNPEEMTDDPQFRPSADRGDVDGIIQPGGAPIDVCGDTGNPGTVPPCGLTYCGAGSTCALDAAGNEGCQCGSGLVARAFVQPDGTTPSVTCVSADLNVLDGVAGLSACDGVDCGEGTCASVNGSATCLCRASVGESDPGTVAVLDAQSRAGVTCVAATTTVGDDQLEWPAPVVLPPEGACAGPAMASSTQSRVGGQLSAMSFAAVSIVALRALLRRRHGRGR